MGTKNRDKQDYNPIENIYNSLSKSLQVELNETDVIDSASGEFIDRSVWQQIIKLQSELNNRVAPGWLKDRNNKYDWWKAILEEMVEVIGTSGWKWWREDFQKIDYDNVKTELIDLFHFALSLAIKEKSTDVMYAQFVNREANGVDPGCNTLVTVPDRRKRKLNSLEFDEFEINPPICNPKKWYDDLWDRLLLAAINKTTVVFITWLVDFWYSAGFTVNDFFFEYQMKYVLNQHRQDFGYGQGTYKKIWPIDRSLSILNETFSENITEIEDNYITRVLLQQIPLDENFIERGLEELAKYYTKTVDKDNYFSSGLVIPV